MQFFNFIFLARSWASDRIYLVKQLALLCQRAQLRDTPLTFILYPEGTLVSQDTRPISKKYADKLRIVSLHHQSYLLPSLTRFPARRDSHHPSTVNRLALQPTRLVVFCSESPTARYHCGVPRYVPSFSPDQVS
jgi:1-acyl-sn-glycerol-3-phosphate acyltransferase